MGPGTGAFTVNVLEAKGLNGGIGGDGGNGGSAVGSNGGSGGDALGTDQDGGRLEVMEVLPQLWAVTEKWRRRRKQRNYFSNRQQLSLIQTSLEGWRSRRLRRF